MMKRKPNKAELYRQTVSAAMPEVKALVQRYGRKAISNCITRIRNFEKEMSELAALEKRVAEKRAKLKP